MSPSLLLHTNNVPSLSTKLINMRTQIGQVVRGIHHFRRTSNSRSLEEHLVRGLVSGESRLPTYCLVKRDFTLSRFQRKDMTSSKKLLVVGVSGVTCGGKTTLTKLLRRTFPWAKVIYQDNYFYDDDDERHVRLKDVDNHVNYEVLGSLDMGKMCSDVEAILKGIDEGIVELPTEVPNDMGDDLLQTVKPVDCDLSAYEKTPIVIIEGFTIFALDYLKDNCDLRFFVTLGKEQCQKRRDTRNYNPPDCPGYFEKCVWPEYVKHYEEFIEKFKITNVHDVETENSSTKNVGGTGAGDSERNVQNAIHVFDGSDSIQDIWDKTFKLVKGALEKSS